MKQVFVVYETDAWHTIANRDCKGIYTSKRSAINAIVKNHEILEMNYQTQGYSTNYDIEVWNVNDWG